MEMVAMLTKHKTQDARHKTQSTGHVMLRGQIWSTDLMAASLVVVFILLFFVLAWNDLSMRWNNAQSYRILMTDAVAASEALFTTPGDPPSWHRLAQLNSTNIKAIGLVDGRNEINNLKLERMRENNYSNYNLTRSLLGLDRYKLRVTIMDIARNITIFEMGNAPGANASTAAMERFVIVNKSAAIGKIEVYT